MVDDARATLRRPPGTGSRPAAAGATAMIIEVELRRAPHVN
ncbi:MAG: hypothetical protein ACQGVC_02420 [Myxococcota bacterium]